MDEPEAGPHTSTAGTALVGNLATSARLLLRQGFVIEATNSADDDFTKNKTKFRVEERFALGVTRPDALCKVTLTPAA